MLHLTRGLGRIKFSVKANVNERGKGDGRLSTQGRRRGKGGGSGFLSVWNSTNGAFVFYSVYSCSEFSRRRLKYIAQVCNIPNFKKS